jgi:hypothetical protein
MCDHNESKRSILFVKNLKKYISLSSKEFDSEFCGDRRNTKILHKDGRRRLFQHEALAEYL